MKTRKHAGFSKSLILTPLNSSDDYSLLDNTISLSTRHESHRDKNYFIKLSPNNNVDVNPVYYPVSFDPNISADKIKLSLRLKMHFGYRLNSEYEFQLTEISPETVKKCENISLVIQRMVPYNLGRNYAINTDDFTKLIVNRLRNFPVSLGQFLYFPYDKDNSIELKVESVNYQSDYHSDSPAIYYLDEKSKIDFSLPRYTRNITLVNNDISQNAAANNVLPGSNPDASELPAIEVLNLDVPIPDSSASMLPKTFTLDFKSKGIGGHTKELEHLIRETFYSRALGNNFAAAYGVNHTKGILLYGPPGTGKTLIAREIGKLFSPDKVKVVNGPELKNQYVGQSTANLRKIFEDAIWDWRIYGKHSDIHVIILDEIDVLCPKRGTRTNGTGVDDDMVAQLLTILDGVDSPQNIIVIGLTNRKDLLDPALLRPGRLGVHIEISLPDEQARLEIFTIKTKTMRENGLLDDSVNSQHWAKATQNYTGAEIEALVQNAAYFAMGGNFDLSSGKTDLVVNNEIKDVHELKRVTVDHFHHAFAEITPAFGVNKNNFNFNHENFVIYNNEIQAIIADFKSAMQTLAANKDANRLQYLITGDSGVGKTYLAKYLAELSAAKFIRVLSPDRLLGLTLQQQLSLIDEEFYNASQSGLSVIILDELESLLQADANLVSYNNSLRLKFESLLKNMSDTPNKCIIIATTKNQQFIQDMQLLTLFNESIAVGKVSLKQFNSPAVFETFKLICQPLGIKVLPAKVSDEQREIELPIRELIYKIKKFCSENNGCKELNIDLFYDYIQEGMLRNLYALSSTLQGNLPAQINSSRSSNLTVLRQSGSPLHQQNGNGNLHDNKVNYITPEKI